MVSLSEVNVLVIGTATGTQTDFEKKYYNATANNRWEVKSGDFTLR